VGRRQGGADARGGGRKGGAREVQGWCKGGARVGSLRMEPLVWQGGLVGRRAGVQDSSEGWRVSAQGCGVRCAAEAMVWVTLLGWGQCDRHE